MIVSVGTIQQPIPHERLADSKNAVELGRLKPEENVEACYNYCAKEGVVVVAAVGTVYKSSGAAPGYPSWHLCSNKI
jgi:hypothetical protein